MSTADLAKQAGMSEAQWKEAIKFDSTDRGWIIMSIGMAIGAGIVFLPVQVGLVGVWVFLLSALIAYPSIYLLQRLFINTLADSPDCNDYPSIIGGYLGKNWGFFLGILYFMMSLICVFMYSTALTNDSASFLQSFGVTKGLLSDNPLYGLAVICFMVVVASRCRLLGFVDGTVMGFGQPRSFPRLVVYFEADDHYASLYTDFYYFHSLFKPYGHFLSVSSYIHSCSTV